MAKLFESDIKTTQTTTLITPQDGDYVPLQMISIVPEDKISFDAHLKIKKSAEGDYQYVVCCPQGEIFQTQWLEKLTAKGITQIYFHRRHYPEVLDYTYRSQKLALEDDNISPREKTAQVYETTLLWIRHIFSDQNTRVGPQIKIGAEFVGSLFDCLQDPTYHRDWLQELCRHDRSLYTHSLNTCLLSLSFARFLQWPKIRIQAFGLGVMMHDIGATRVPIEILNKPETILTEEERYQVRKHPLHGFNDLKDFAQIWREALIMIQQHHEKGDGSGYPEGLKLAAIHPWAQILRIIDSYDSMTAGLYGHQKHTPAQALLTMRQEWEEKKTYNANYLGNFIKCLASTPSN